MRERRVWLMPELGNTKNGHYQFEGDSGQDRVAVIIDPTILERLGPDKEQELVGLHSKIQRAATGKLQRDEAYPCLQGPTREKVLLITLTDQDLDW